METLKTLGALGVENVMELMGSETKDSDYKGMVSHEKQDPERNELFGQVKNQPS